MEICDIYNSPIQVSLEDTELYLFLCQLFNENSLYIEDLDLCYKYVDKRSLEKRYRGTTHALAVTFNTISLIKIALKENTDNFQVTICNAMIREIIFISMFHDMLDDKFCTDKAEDYIDNIEREIRELLTNRKITKYSIDMILEIINNISFNKQKRGELEEYTVMPTIQRALWTWVSTGDFIEAIGYYGIVRAFQFIEVAKDNYKHLKAGDYPAYLEEVIKDMEEKLLLIIPSYMKINIATKIFQPFQRQMEIFYSRCRRGDTECCLQEILRDKEDGYKANGKNILLTYLKIHNIL